VLSNVTDSSLTATVAIDGINPAQASLAIIRLAAHETCLINPEQLARNGKGTLLEIGGISINYNGAAGALLARGFIEELSTGFSSSIEFWDPSMAHSSKLDGGGLRLGRAGGKELTPVVVARNIGTTESIVSGSVSYTAADGSTSIVSLPDTHLRRGEVDAIDVSHALRSSRVNTERLVSAGLQFTYSTTPGSILISAQSVSSDGNQVFRLPLVDADAQPSSTGGYPWFINGSSSTVVYLTNVTDEPQQYVLQLNFQGGVYAPGLKTVAPHQTAVLDIRALRDGQVKDEHNQTIPPDATHGQVQWSIEGPENLTLIGRAEQGDSLNGMSSSYACVNCCPPSCVETWIDPPSVTGVSGDTQQFTAIQQNEDCFGNLLSPFSRSATWSSTNSSVATVNSTGFATAQNPGSTNIQGTWTAFLWDLNPNNTCTKTTIHPDPTALCDVVCTTPTDETTTFAGWADSDGYPTVGKWTQTLSPTSPGFSGRIVTEQDPGGGGPDNCWFSGSAISPTTAITGGYWTVASNNTWGFDAVGLTSSTVTYYRAQGRAPCSVTVPQRMVIDCSTGAVTYRSNTLGYVIGDTTVISIRDGSQQSRTWP
jgi:hypothetical protein